LKTSNKRRGTKTSSFGTSGRISHDSTAFYTSKLYEDLPNEKKVKYTENIVPPESLNKILCKSSESMDELADSSVHLMVTSPPYNVGKEYDCNLTLKNYREFLKRVWQEVHRVLVPGGRACINVANLGRKPYIPLHAMIAEDMIEDDAPKTVANFEKLINKGFYNGLIFHKVIPNFVIQGGCPKGDGIGGPGYSIKCEINPRKHTKGALSMALAAAPSRRSAHGLWSGGRGHGCGEQDQAGRCYGAGEGGLRGEEWVRPTIKCSCRSIQ
jgi:hypothetical protein